MELDTRVNGMRQQTREMERDIRYGLMAHSMRDTGRMTRLMVEVDLFMLMEMSMRVNGKMIKHMDMESTCTQMVLNTKDIGGKTSNTVKAKRHGQTEPATKVTT